ncbi:MAG: hypothetical protein IIV56_06365, partial [Mailhella sp.]|nr:hypothetical protein [Mailhella sp.]
VQAMLETHPPQEDKALASEESLRGFLSAEGQDSLFTARVDVELPAEALPADCRAVEMPVSELASLCGRSAAGRLRRELGDLWTRPIILCLPSSLS